MGGGFLGTLASIGLSEVLLNLFGVVLNLLRRQESDKEAAFCIVQEIPAVVYLLNRYSQIREESECPGL
jgi:hypothetical protein